MITTGRYNKTRIAHNLLCAPFVIAGVVFILLMSGYAMGQDIHYSQYENSPMNLNPAQTGFFDGDLRFTANHRNQWNSVTTPYKTFSGSFDMAVASKGLNRHAVGIQFNSDRAGDSKLGLMQFLLSYGISHTFDADQRHTVSLGLQAGFTLRSVNYNDLVFDEQFDGDGFNSQLTNTENFDNSNHSYPEINAGIAYVYKPSGKFKIGTGIGLQHLNRPEDSFFGKSVKVHQRLQFDIKADAALTEKIGLIPSLLYMNQGSFKELTGGASVRLHINQKPGKNYALYLGGYMRKQDAIIASAGMDINNLFVGASYDINTSDLERASNNRGGFELSAIYIITKVKPQAPKPPCPVY